MNDVIIMYGSALGNLICRLVKSRCRLYLPVSFEFLLARYFSGKSAKFFQTRLSASFITNERFFSAYCTSSECPLGFKYTKSNLPQSVLYHKIIPELECYQSKLLADVEHYTKFITVNSELNKVLKRLGYERYFLQIKQRLTKSPTMSELFYLIADEAVKHGEILPNAFESALTYGNKLLFIETIKTALRDLHAEFEFTRVFESLPEIVEKRSVYELIENILNKAGN
ncbi:MAG: hypothetical protein NC548_29425 [Lachnospiraceae bacterium]|nr:hypothetical protein [Lachnospiraceae bacterium]